jgi:hypothetical protein
MICHKLGFCLQCEYGRCANSFHIPCAARSLVKLELREMNDRVYFHQFCPKHAHLSDYVETDNTAGPICHKERRTSLSLISPAPKRHNSLPLSPTVSRHKGPFVLLLTGLDLSPFILPIDIYSGLNMDNSSLQTVLTSQSHVSVVLNLSDSVTHVVTKCFTSGAQIGKTKARTVRYMFGVARGIYCVSHAWIQDWAKFRTPPDELRYEVIGDYAAIGAPRRSRVCRQQGKTPLFHSVTFLITVCDLCCIYLY